MVGANAHGHLLSRVDGQKCASRENVSRVAPPSTYQENNNWQEMSKPRTYLTRHHGSTVDHTIAVKLTGPVTNRLADSAASSRCNLGNTSQSRRNLSTRPNEVTVCGSCGAI